MQQYSGANHEPSSGVDFYSHGTCLVSELSEMYTCESFYADSPMSLDSVIKSGTCGRKRSFCTPPWCTLISLHHTF